MQELEAKKLLDLPAEIIRAILYELDPADLYICLLTSKLFRDHALNSTHLLLAQISRVPGLGPQNRDGLSATDLLRIFGTRATRHLRHGVQMANVHSWRSEEKTSKERSMILRLPNANSDAWFLDTLAYFRIQDDASVHVYTIDFSEDEYGRAEYKPTLKHIITPYSIHRRYPCRDGLDHTIEVLKIASHPGSFDYWNQPLIAVLYRVTRRDRHGVRHSWRTIIIFALDWDFGPVVLDTLSTEPQLAKPEKVSAMAVSRTGVVVVVSRKHDDLLDHQVSFYWKWEDKETHDSYTGEHTTSTMNRDDFRESEIARGEQIDDVVTRGEKILFLPADIPMPQWSLHGALFRPQGDWIHEVGLFRRRNNHLPNTIFTFTRASLGRAIASHHHCQISDPELNDGEETCLNTVLQLAITRGDDESYRSDGRTGAYLIKGFEYPDECISFDLQKDHPFLEHFYVAKLVGLPDLDNLSTLGLKVAVSPRGCRIAMASWKTVKVWALDPKAFLDPHYGNRGGPSAGDYAYAECCGHDFYDCEKFEEIFVLLEPVELPNSKVIYGMEFRDENELWAWCEDGVIRWTFDAHATMERMVHVL